MKYKYLVLLFLATLLTGLAIREAPWQKKTEVQIAVIRLDTALMTQVSVHAANGQEWSLLKSDQLWNVEQDGRSVSVPQPDMDTLCRLLAEIRSTGICPPKIRVDSFFRTNSIKCFVWYGNIIKERFEVAPWHGNEILLRISGKPEVVYMADALLLRLLSKDLNTFRSGRAFAFQPHQVEGLRIRQKDTLLFEWHQLDTLGLNPKDKHLAMAFRDSIGSWCDTLRQLSSGAFADFFDESNRRNKMYMEINIALTGQKEPLQVSIMHFLSGELPEDLSSVRRQSTLPAFILNTSQNPNNYFVVKDSSLVFRLIRQINKWKASDKALPTSTRHF